MNSFWRPARPAFTGTRIAALMGSMALVLAACAGSGAATTGPTTAAATTAAATQAASAAASQGPGESQTAGEAYVLNVAQDAKYGAILTGEEGKSLLSLHAGFGQYQHLQGRMRRLVAAVHRRVGRDGPGGRRRHRHDHDVPASGRLDAACLQRHSALLLLGRRRGRHDRTDRA